MPVAAVLIIWGGGLTRLAGLLFLLLIPLSALSSAAPLPNHPALSPEEKQTVGAYAAAMWRYYEELCGPEDHYLPPDNLRGIPPVWRVAHRTSPTNIGLYLLCIVAAADFGFVDEEGMLLRLERTIRTVEKLEKWKGNLLNWYDTRTLRPLSPAISPPWTAAIWPAAWWRRGRQCWSMRCPNMGHPDARRRSAGTVNGPAGW